MNKLGKICLLGLVAASLCAAGASLVVATGSAHPLAEMTRLADKIGKGDVSIKLESVARD